MSDKLTPLPRRYRITVTRTTEATVARLLSPWRQADTAHWQTRVAAPGSWIVHCLLCKDRVQFTERDEAMAYASVGHLRWPAHQRLVGRYTLGLEIPEARGYDWPSSRQNPRNTGCGSGWEGSGEALWMKARGQHGELEKRLAARRSAPTRVSAARDELSARREVPPPRLDWTTSSPLGPATVTWSDGRYSSGTFYDLYCNDRYVAQIVALAEGGWLFNGRHFPDDAALIRAAS
ncbi:hypothetical protein ACFQE5_22255 [Pseudonocardia hispaniensis]|uniref:Uncharacterized protein n=1 Tax=Pseudonocardia hispaniensis TaxID=904933 RepID=A0ABW1J921_9PSEU